MRSIFKNYVFRDSKNILANAELAKTIIKASIATAFYFLDMFDNDIIITNKIKNNAITKSDLEPIKVNFKTKKAASDLKFKARTVDPLVIENDRAKLLSECYGI